MLVRVSCLRPAARLRGTMGQQVGMWLHAGRPAQLTDDMWQSSQHEASPDIRLGLTVGGQACSHAG